MKNFETTFSLYYRGKKKLNIFMNQCLFLNNVIYKPLRIYYLRLGAPQVFVLITLISWGISFLTAICFKNKLPC